MAAAVPEGSGGTPLETPSAEGGSGAGVSGEEEAGVDNPAAERYRQAEKAVTKLVQEAGSEAAALSLVPLHYLAGRVRRKVGFLKECRGCVAGLGSLMLRVGNC